MLSTELRSKQWRAHPSHAMLALLYRLSAWIKAQAEHLLLEVLAAGPIPSHVAFVMDGNRRYARGRRMDVRQGHVDGFASLRRVTKLSAFTHLGWLLMERRY